MAISPIATHPTVDGSHAVNQSQYIDNRVLAATTVETFQAPAGAKYVRIAADGGFFLRIAPTSSAAAVPAADVTDGSGSEYQTGAPEWKVLPGDQAYISVIASATRVISLSFFSN